MGLTYRIRDTMDAEERLEDAAMFKALWDATRGKIIAIREGAADFGAEGSLFKHEMGNPYWSDPAFLRLCGRRFMVTDYNGLEKAVDSIHRDGCDAFIKAGLLKFFLCKVPQGSTARQCMGDMVYSFIDSPVPIMVQECVDFTFEHRFFIFDRKIITWSPAAYKLTPIDYPIPNGIAWRKQSDIEPVSFGQFDDLYAVAKYMAENMIEQNGIVDVGMIGENPAIIEINPWRVGMFGLFACDVRAIANAVINETL